MLQRWLERKAEPAAEDDLVSKGKNMFDRKVYIARREKLSREVAAGLILLPGNDEMPMNYKNNTYRFRQDSSFLYFNGLDLPGLAVVIDADKNKTILFGNDLGLDDIIWMGPQTPLAEQASGVGIDEVQPLRHLPGYIGEAIEKKRPLHYLPPYHESQISNLSQSTGWPRGKVEGRASEVLIRAVIGQRSIKGSEEIEELEEAVDIARDMHITVMKMAKAGNTESEIAGHIEGIALARGAGVSFSVILSIHGEILHNHSHGNRLSDGDLLINDSGAESALHYASDITRTIPVGGRFTQRQKDIYQIVLRSQMAAIEAIAPGRKNIDIHLQCAQIISAGLKDLGLMRGNIEDAVIAGAHALFFPHGLGHMLGLDVHDMEGLGENLVGYNQEVKRSDQFGLAYLRLARTLQPGYVLTVEPGIYFIPALIDKWKQEKRCETFINYERVQDYTGFGGIRIEDDVLVTDTGARVLGKPIPKTIHDVEAACGE